MNFHASISQAMQELQNKTGEPYTVLMQDGNMKLGYYAPVITDPQAPHAQDEIYVIASGGGSFFRNGERVSFKTGDVLFVPSGMEHRFENFTDDFATWVVFYGDTH